MHESNPLISIIIPTYNQAHFLLEALESVRSQTYTNWEAIVVNNYSEDDTASVVNNIDDPRIRLINFKNNGVIAASRNVGIAQARGKYVALLDSDDTWYPKKLDSCVKILGSGYDLVGHAVVFRDERGSRKQVYPKVSHDINYAGLLYGASYLTTSTMIIRKTILEKFAGFSENPLYITAEDYDLWLCIAKANARMYFLNEHLGEYRIHSTSASQSAIKHMKAALAVLKEHHDATIAKTVWNDIQYRKQISRIITSNAWVMSKSDNWRDAFYTVGRGIKIWPFYWKAYAVVLLTCVFSLGCLVKRTSL